MQEDAQETPPNISIPYLLFTFGVGIGLVVLFAVAGYQGWPFVTTVLLGAAAQTVFRVTKRAWRYALEPTQLGDAEEETSTRLAFTAYLLIYAVMLFVTALWYGVGAGVGRLF